MLDGNSTRGSSRPTAPAGPAHAPRPGQGANLYVAAGTTVVPSLQAHLPEVLDDVLAGLALPAQRRQIITYACHLGASPALCAVLSALPNGIYTSRLGILTALATDSRPSLARPSPHEPDRRDAPRPQVLADAPGASR